MKKYNVTIWVSITLIDIIELYIDAFILMDKAQDCHNQLQGLRKTK
jgi:hypothetical protein